MANIQFLKFKDITKRFIPYSFRSRIEENTTGVKVIQMKDVSVNGIDWNGVVKTEFTGKKEPEFLRNGDLLILSRGLKQLTITFEEEAEGSKSICSNMFYHYRVCNDSVTPDYLTFVLNNNQSIRHIIDKKAASGSATSNSFPREAIESLLIPIPPINEQNSIVALQANIKRQNQCYQQLINSNQAMLTSIASKLTK